MSKWHSVVEFVRGSVTAWSFADIHQKQVIQFNNRILDFRQLWLPEMVSLSLLASHRLFLVTGYRSFCLCMLSSWTEPGSFPPQRHPHSRETSQPWASLRFNQRCLMASTEEHTSSISVTIPHHTHTHNTPSWFVMFKRVPRGECHISTWQKKTLKFVIWTGWFLKKKLYCNLQCIVIWLYHHFVVCCCVKTAQQYQQMSKLSNLSME